MPNVKTADGYVVETPFGYYIGVMGKPRKITGFLTGSDYPIIICTEDINKARFFSFKETAKAMAAEVRGEIIPAIKVTAVDIRRRDEKPASLGLVISEMIEQQQEEETPEELFPAVMPDPSYYEEDCGYQPDPDWEE